MNIEVNWDHPAQTVVRWDFWEGWTWEDFVHSWEQTQMLTPNADLIGNFTGCATFPVDLPPPGLFERTLLNYNDNDSLVILVGCTSQLHEFIAQWLEDEPMLRQIIAFVDTLDEARMILDYTDDEVLLSDQPDYEIYWQVPQKVLYIKLFANLSLEFLDEFNNEILQLLDESDNEICIIWDFATLDIIQGNVLDIRKKLSFINHPKLIWLIVLSATSIVKLSIEILSQTSHISPLYHHDLDEAADFLEHIDFLAE